ncbi:MAG: DUF2085 domain-containing protein [Chloroflexi bacterium]|nr:DUF2085 domain-containing protein [Chloroflexota bacterium]
MGAIEWLLSGICHQLAENSLVYDGRPLPLCARCSGAFLGFALTLGVLRAIEPGRPTRWPNGAAAAVLGVLVAAWVADGANSAVASLFGRALYAPSNGLRLVTGVGLGLVLGALLYPAYHQVLWRHTSARPVLSTPARLGALLTAGALLAALLWVWRSAPRTLWVAAASVAALVTLAATNATLLVLLARREGRGESWLMVAPDLLVGAGMTLAELSLIAGLRAML